MLREEDCIIVGKVSKSHNLNGEVVIVSENTLLEKYVNEPVFLLLDGSPVPFFIAEDGLTIRNHNSYIIKFQHVDTLEDAEELISSEVMLGKNVINQKDLEEDVSSIFDTVGFKVIDENSSEEGFVEDITDYSGNIVFTLKIFDKQLLLPYADIYINRIDYEYKKILVNIPIELIDLN